MLELALQGDGVGKLPGFDAADDGLEDAAMDGVGEMLGGEELGNPFIGLVVGQQGAEQGLLGLGVGGRLALGKPQQWRIDAVHVARSIAPSAAARPVDCCG